MLSFTELEIKWLPALLVSSDSNGHDFGILEELSDTKKITYKDAVKLAKGLEAKGIMTVYEKHFVNGNKKNQVTQYTFKDGMVELCEAALKPVEAVKPKPATNPFQKYLKNNCDSDLQYQILVEAICMEPAGLIGDKLKITMEEVMKNLEVLFERFLLDGKDYYENRRQLTKHCFRVSATIGKEEEPLNDAANVED